MINGLRRDRDVVFEIGQPVALLKHQLAVLDDRDRCPWCAGLVRGLKKVIQTFDAVILRKKDDWRTAEEEEQLERRQSLYDEMVPARKI